MKRLLLLLISVFALVSTSWADPITREQALGKAQQFLSQKGLSRSLTAAETQMSRARAKGKNTPDYYYVFNAGQNQGFVIVSGDDRTETILGYSDKGSFDVDQIPSNLEAWLEGYAAQIKYVREHATLQPSRMSKVFAASVEPIVKVHWDQNSPYNKYCFLDLPKTDIHIQAATGCVATAMAQAMSVFKYPSATIAEIPGYEVNFGSNGYATYEAIAAGAVIDWANILDSYNGSETEDQKDAIAKLMSYCGRSVEMIYNGDGSSASVSDIPKALKSYFGYGNQIAYKQRSWSSDEDWEAMIYNEVASGRPVIYGGQTAENGGIGHAFIVDGYDKGGDAFHINWGWGQLYQSPDGYFKLSALNPEVQGTGGSNEAYNFGQEAIIGIDKNSSGETETVIATVANVLFDKAGTNIQTAINNPKSKVEFTKSSGYAQMALYFQFQNHLANIYSFSFGMGIFKDGSLVGDVISVGNKENLDNSTTYTTGWSIYYFGKGLANGDYELKALSKEKDSSGEWMLCEDADKHKAYIRVSDNQIIFSTSDLSGPSDPEVSDDQRNELKGVLDGLKDVIGKKQKTVAANNNEIKELQAAMAEISQATDNADAKLTSLEKLVADSKLLTDEKKKGFNDKIAGLKTEKDQLKEKIDAVNADLEKIKATNDLLATRLEEALAAVNEQAAGVSGITTTVALEAAKAKATGLKEGINGYNADEVAADIKNLKSNVAAIDVSTIATSIAALETEVNKAIEEAEAGEEEKQKKELEETKACMKATLEAITKSAEEKLETIEAKNKTITDLRDAIKEASDAAAAVSAKIAAIKEKLANELLTENQKADHLTKLTGFEAELNSYKTALSKLSEKLDETEKTCLSLKNSLDEAKKSAEELTAKVDAATKKDEVEALKTDAETAQKKVDDVDFAALTKALSDIEEEQKKLSIENTQKALSDLEAIVDEVIADAEATAMDEKEKKELEEAKASMKSALDAVSQLVADKSEALEANDKAIANLKNDIQTASEAAKSVTKKMETIKTLLEDKSLTEAQKTDNLAKLAKLEEKLKDYQASLSALTEKLAEAEKTNSNLKTSLDEVKKSVEGLLAKIDAATKKDDIEALKTDAEAVQKKVNDVDSASVAKDIEAIAASVKALTIDDVSEALATLEKAIQEIIDAVKSEEEKEKEQAEKLAKAKEECGKAVEKLNEAIEEQTTFYNFNLGNLNMLIEALAEINEYIAMFQTQADEISQMLSKLTSSASRTRATEDEIAKYRSALELINSRIAELQEGAKKVREQLSVIQKSVDDLKVTIEAAEALRDKIAEDANNATSIEEVEALTSQALNKASDLENNGTSAAIAVDDQIDDAIDNINEVIELLNGVYYDIDALHEEVTEATGINSIMIAEKDIQGRYNINGRPVDANYKGIVIIRMNDGTTKKVNIKR